MQCILMYFDTPLFGILLNLQGIFRWCRGCFTNVGRFCRVSRLASEHWASHGCDLLGLRLSTERSENLSSLCFFQLPDHFGAAVPWLESDSSLWGILSESACQYLWWLWSMPRHSLCLHPVGCETSQFRDRSRSAAISCRAAVQRPALPCPPNGPRVRPRRSSHYAAVKGRNTSTTKLPWLSSTSSMI